LLAKFLLFILLIGATMEAKIEKITLGGGCFWCVEAVYSGTRGVKKAISGYANGHTRNPTYKDVCTGATGHAEVIQIEFDDDIISLEKVLDIFWAIHDPTTLNRQGADAGTQYRSCIYFEDEKQKNIIAKSLQKAQSEFRDKIVTEVAPLLKFYPAEDYHQNYFAKNPNQGYCAAVVAPKVHKFHENFKDLAK
jgi:peptide-methionine (S)-S-oxide reductase